MARPSTRARMGLVAWAALTASLVLALATAASATLAPGGHAPAPTVTFTSAVGLCTSRPSVNSMSIVAETRLDLVNLTGAAARLISNSSHDEVAVAGGRGVSVKLDTGQHTLRMVPACLVDLGGAEALVVTVVQRARSPQPSAVLSSWSWPTPAVTPTAGDRRTPTGLPRPIRSDAVATSDAAATGPTGRERGTGGELHDVVQFPVAQSEDPRDGRLIAIIAVICVCGVTMAIIRVIVA